MRIFSVSELASVVDGRVSGEGAAQIGPDVVIDSRLATKGSVFVALPGERVDGHDYVDAAAARGAAAAFVSREVTEACASIIVDDPAKALSELAHAVVMEAISRQGLTTIALTGSSGKTSTKDLAAQIFADAGLTVAPQGNYNNEIGVPLTACAVDSRTRFLVSEMGARGIGHIAHLCQIVPPQISAILNVGTAHLGEFGGQEQIAKSKGEIVEALPADGWAVLNADDPLVVQCSAQTKARICWFGVESSVSLGGNYVHASDIRSWGLERYRFTLNVDVDGIRSSHDVELQVAGRHNISNALAASAMAVVAGLDPAQIADSLSQAKIRSPWRMEVQQSPSGALVINDAYNANPESMRAGVSTLARLGANARRKDPSARTIAILGDMAELGDDADKLHHELGRYISSVGIDVLLAIGEYAEQVISGACGVGEAHIVTKDQALALVTLNPHDVVLVKASRAVGLEDVAEALTFGSPVNPSLEEAGL